MFLRGGNVAVEIESKLYLFLRYPLHIPGWIIPKTAVNKYYPQNWITSKLHYKLLWRFDDLPDVRYQIIQLQWSYGKQPSVPNIFRQVYSNYFGHNSLHDSKLSRITRYPARESLSHDWWLLPHGFNKSPCSPPPPFLSHSRSLIFSADMWIFYGGGTQSLYIVSGCGIRLVRSMRRRRRGAS